MVAGYAARGIQTAITYGQKLLGGTKSVGKSVGKGAGVGAGYAGATGVMGALTEPVDMGNQGPLAAGQTAAGRGSGGLGFSAGSKPLISAAQATDVLSDADSGDPVVRQLQDIEKVLVDIRSNTENLTGTGTGAKNVVPPNEAAISGMFGKKASPSAGVGLGIGAALLTRVAKATPDASEIVDESGLKNSVEEFLGATAAEITGIGAGLQKGLAAASEAAKKIIEKVRPTPVAVDPPTKPTPKINKAGQPIQTRNAIYDPQTGKAVSTRTGKQLTGSALQATKEAAERAVPEVAEEAVEQTTRRGAVQTLKTVGRVGLKAVAPVAAVVEGGLDAFDNEKKFEAIQQAYDAGEISQEEYDMAQTALQANRAGSAGRAGGALTGAASGAAMGAAIGSVVPLVGTFIGGLVGGIVGGVAGAEFGDDLGTKAAELAMDSEGGSQELLDKIALKSGYGQDAEELAADTMEAATAEQLENASDTSARIEAATESAAAPASSEAPTVNIQNNNNTQAGGNQTPPVVLKDDRIDHVEASFFGTRISTMLGF